MRPRLWIISELYFPDAQATAKILTTLAEGLATTHEVVVLCAYPTLQFHPPVEVGKREHRHGVEIRRFPSTRFDKSVLVYRTVNATTASISAFVHLIFHLRRTDRVLAVTNPPVMPFVASLAARMKGATCFVLAHDLYPDVLVPTGLMRRDSWLFRILQASTRWLFRGVQGIVVLGRDAAELVASYLGGSPTQVAIIPNWSEPDRIVPRPRSHNSILRSTGLSEQFVILHAGTMGRTHGIEDILEAARRSSKRTDLRFVFSGLGIKRSTVEAAIKTGTYENVTLLPFVDDSEQNELLNACDVAVIAMVVGMYGISVPSRMYNTMASGKPIIAMTDAGSELARVVEEEQIGWVVRPGDIDGLLAAIDQARSQPALLAEKGRRARHLAETRYTSQASIMEFTRFLTQAATR